MIIGERLREMREAKQLSQGDMEERTGLFRCYISRVENGHTVPVIETIEKFARAVEVPMYQLFYDGEGSPKLPHLLKRNSSGEIAWGSAGKDARFLSKLRRCWARQTNTTGSSFCLWLRSWLGDSYATSVDFDSS